VRAEPLAQVRAHLRVAAMTNSTTKLDFHVWSGLTEARSLLAISDIRDAPMRPSRTEERHAND
jgi:hypothetical protein